MGAKCDCLRRNGLTQVVYGKMSQILRFVGIISFKLRGQGVELVETVAMRKKVF